MDLGCEFISIQINYAYNGSSAQTLHDINISLRVYLYTLSSLPPLPPPPSSLLPPLNPLSSLSLPFLSLSLSLSLSLTLSLSLSLSLSPLSLSPHPSHRLCSYPHGCLSLPWWCVSACMCSCCVCCTRSERTGTSWSRGESRTSCCSPHFRLPYSAC